MQKQGSKIFKNKLRYYRNSKNKNKKVELILYRNLGRKGRRNAFTQQGVTNSKASVWIV